MDFKGIDFKAFNLLPPQLIGEQREERPLVRPVKKGEKARLRSGKGNRDEKGPWKDSSGVSEEEAAYALEVMSNFLDNNPDLEAILSHSPDLGTVIMVRDRKTKGTVARVEIEDIFSGAVFDTHGRFGTLFDKRI